MSMTGSSSTWSTFLSDLPTSEGSVSISDENSFHRQFKRHCAGIRERDPERLLARFLRHHDQISAFVSALDESTRLDEAKSLGSIFWSKAFEAMELALKTKQKDKFVREYLPKISNIIPAFGAELPLFPDDETVQKPLQNIFAAYMQCYALMLQLLDPQEDAVNLESFLLQIELATQSIAALKEEWEQLVKQAAFDHAQAAARNVNSNTNIHGRTNTNLYNNTQFSYYNTTVGPFSPPTTNVSFEWQETLGKGTFGEVHKVCETSTGTMYAQKVIRVSDPRSRSRVEKDFLNEVSIMQKLRYHHIASVQFHVFEGDTCSLFMLPVADCDLRRFMRGCADNNFPRTELMHLTTWFGCLIGALAFAHSKDIKHEDIKPSNILIKDHQPYLTDFGCAKDFSGLESSTSVDSITTGTPVYWAPESPPRGRRADVFSLGCVFSEMLTTRHKRTLEDFQVFRHVQHRDNGYAFRENLDKVAEWLDRMVPGNDSVGMLLKDQTLVMLELNVGRRKEARDIKRGLRIEGDMVFCNSCN